MKEYKGITGKLISAFVVVGGLYHLLYIAHVFEYFRISIQLEAHRAFHVAFVLALSYLLFSATRRESDKLPWYDVLLALLAIIMPLYFAFGLDSEWIRWGTGKTTAFEIVLGVVGLVLLFEAARRVVGLAMSLLALIFLLYAALGYYFPGFLQHRGFALQPIVNTVVYSEIGLFGFVTGISSTLIIAFIFFGSFLVVSGAGEFFVKIAYALVGKYRGGPAKIAIVASMFFGMISGSTAANVATTGTFTIPLMKRIGYKPAFAGAVEAVASNGGQFTPPVMGAVAFIMAEWLQIPYWNIALAAAIPAVLYYIALYVYVDIEAIRLRLHGLPASEMPSIKGSLKQGWVYAIPVVALVYFIAGLNYAPETASVYSIVLIIVISLFRKETRMGPRKLLLGFKEGMNGVLIAGISCIMASVIVAAIMLTGLGPKITSLLIAASGGSLIILLLLAAIASFVFGMGMGSIPIYIILVSLVTPALENLGIPRLATHLFVFWWGLTSFITPPVAPGVFVACGIAKSKVWETGLIAMRLGMLTYLLPFIWIYQPALILIGTKAQIVIVTLTTVGVVLMAGYGIAGFMLKWWERLLLMAGAAALLTFNWIYGAIGLAIGVGVILSHRWARQRQAHLASGSEKLPG
ncbi:MAG: TRAP transporter fused permease subunit [Chloroflexi bacterium]|nr:TRAP transporter fused permease subunit [Chloroflexota bacterium]